MHVHPIQARGKRSPLRGGWKGQVLLGRRQTKPAACSRGGPTRPAEPWLAPALPRRGRGGFGQWCTSLGRGRLQMPFPNRTELARPCFSVPRPRRRPVPATRASGAESLRNDPGHGERGLPRPLPLNSGCDSDPGWSGPSDGRTHTRVFKAVKSTGGIPNWPRPRLASAPRRPSLPSTLHAGSLGKNVSLPTAVWCSSLTMNPRTNLTRVAGVVSYPLSLSRLRALSHARSIWSQPGLKVSSVQRASASARRGKAFAR